MAPTRTTAAATVAETYREQFRALEHAAPAPAWLAPLRRAGLARFEELGLPTPRHEDWRFTNTAPIARLPFHPALQPADGVTAEQLARLTFSRLPGARLVFINGHFAPQWSAVRGLPPGVKAGSLATALASDPAFVEQHLGRYAQTADNGFAALNQAFFLDGGFVHVPAGTVVAEPIQLLYLSTAGPVGTAVHPRNLILAEAGAEVTILESYVALGGAQYLTNTVTELFAGERARLEFIKFQDEATDAFHLAAFHGEFGRASNVNVHSFALGARLSRNNIRTRLAGEGLECILNGLYLTRGEQLADHHMIVEHARPHCASHEYFNGILDDKSRGVFHGRILVRPEAQKTDAKQTNKNLLLSDDAGADTKPQLEIYADDVKCTHGATIGQLNAESIFYLRSRGLGPETARRMLIHAFAGEIIERIRHEPAREELDRLVWARLEANPHLAGKK
jgi:Fe-S cluster assembly protein SufD